MFVGFIVPPAIRPPINV